MAAKTYNNIVDSRFFAAKETTFATQVDHAGTDVVPHKPTASLTYAEAEEEVEECTGTHGTEAFTRLPQKEVSWSMSESYLKPTDSAANEPDWGNILESAFGAQKDAGNTDTTTAVAHSTTSMTVTTPANWAKGTVVRAAGNVTAGIEDEIVFVTSISGSVVTFAPALSEAPGAAGGDTFTMGWSWTLDKAGDVSFTGVHEMSNVVKHAAGCFAQNLTVKHSRNAAVMASADGVGAGRYSIIGTSTVQGSGIDALGTTLEVTVDSGHGKRFHIGTSSFGYATIEDDDGVGANTEETVKVTGVSGDVLTIARAQKGTALSAHGVGAVIKPWSPTLTKHGSPLASTAGSLTLGTVAFNLHEFSWTLANGRVLREDLYGAGGIADGIVPGENNSQKVTASITAKFTQSALEKWGYAQQATTQALLNKTGSNDVGTIVTYIPAFRYKIPELPEGAPEAMITIEGQALETSGDDEIFFGIV